MRSSMALRRAPRKTVTWHVLGVKNGDEGFVEKTTLERVALIANILHKKQKMPMLDVTDTAALNEIDLYFKGLPKSPRYRRRIEIDDEFEFDGGRYTVKLPVYRDEAGFAMITVKRIERRDEQPRAE
jgi:hypothetical protein